MANMEEALSRFRTIGWSYRGPPMASRSRKFTRAAHTRSAVELEDD
jgi:hypothetical protein